MKNNIKEWNIKANYITECTDTEIVDIIDEINKAIINIIERRNLYIGGIITFKLLDT